MGYDRFSVTIDNFVRAETDRTFAAIQADAGGVNQIKHNREVTPIDHQTVVRMNRDTLYSAAVVDILQGASVTIPDGGDRYISVMVVNYDHYVNRVSHEPGAHRLTVDEFETPWVLVGLRILVDPEDPEDLATVSTLQDQLRVDASSATPFAAPDYDTASLDETRVAIKALLKHAGGFDRSFGSRQSVDPVRHLIGAAAGWGGLPDTEARYIGVEPRKPVGTYTLTVRDVPVDGFWSVSVYNAEGFFEPNERDAYSVNNLTATPDEDGSITIHFGGCAGDRPNCLPIVEGWNYTVRLYRPRPELLDGSWAFPEIEDA
jgi:hypothetical protein